MTHGGTPSHLVPGPDYSRADGNAIRLSIVLKLMLAICRTHGCIRGSGCRGSRGGFEACGEVQRMLRLYERFLCDGKPLLITQASLRAANERMGQCADEFLAAEAEEKSARAEEAQRRLRKRRRGGPA